MAEESIPPEEPAAPGSTDKTTIPVRSNAILDLRRVLISDGEQPSLLAVATTVTALASAYLYFTGFIYSYFLYDTFGISLDALDLATPYYLIHAYSVFSTWIGLLVAQTYIAVLLAGAILNFRHWVYVAILVSAFPAVFYSSYHAGRGAANELRLHPHILVAIRFKDPEKSQTPNLLLSPQMPDTDQSDQQVFKTLADNDNLWLLCQSKDKILVFSQSQGNLTDSTRLLPTRVYIIPISEIEWSMSLVQ